MDRCFVIQPFDQGPFDKRYKDVFDPAITKAGLDPYRVDRDPAVEIPIQDIETGIKSSKACFAEITTNNPNVWFELGYALALNKPVCLACSDERKTPFPFDVQHRHIITYSVESTSDFNALHERIFTNIRAMLEKRDELHAVAELAPTMNTKGLPPHEVAVLLALMKYRPVSGSMTGWQIRQDMDGAGFTEVAAAIAMESLRRKALVDTTIMDEPDGPTTYWFLTSDGVDWILANQGSVQLRKAAGATSISVPPAKEGDIPF